MIEPERVACYPSSRCPRNCGPREVWCDKASDGARADDDALAPARDGAGARRVRRFRIASAASGGVRAAPGRLGPRVARRPADPLPRLEPARRAHLRSRAARVAVRSVRRVRAARRRITRAPARAMTYRRKDTHYRRARAAGYRARSSYKLLELDARFRLLHAGDRVVDLGAWPGAWLQVARECVGPGGRLVGVDVVPVDPLPAANVALVTGDVREPATLCEVLARLDGTAADVVLSDLAPKLTGVRATD